MTVEALRRHRPETLADLLTAYGRELQTVAYLILRDRGEAEDVVIETLLTAFERGGSIRDERALRAWLLRVATNKALGTRRKTGRLTRLDLTPEAAGPGDMASESSTRVVLLDGIAALPLQMRVAVVLRYYADLTVEEIAATLGKSPNTIKAQLQTALDRLRLNLGDQSEISLTEARHA
jgi:RNA polymerase sigma factor (sigma-70 family)